MEYGILSFRHSISKGMKGFEGLFAAPSVRPDLYCIRIRASVSALIRNLMDTASFCTSESQRARTRLLTT